MQNILVDCYVFEGEFQGTRTFIKETYKELFLIELSKEKIDRNAYYLISNNISILKDEFGEFDFVFFIQSNYKNHKLRLLFEFNYFIIKYKIDYAHFQYVVPPLKLCKYIVTIHDILFCKNKIYFTKWYRFKNYFSFYFSYWLSDIITTVSNDSKNDIIKYFPHKKDILITPNGIKNEFFNYNVNYNKNVFLIDHNLNNYILYVSRFEPRKNHFNLLKAYILGQHYTKFDLVLIGSKAYNCFDFDNFYNTIDITIQNKIHIIDYGIDNKTLKLFYSFCSIFVYPSFLEGFGIPPLEASAFNKPVICSNTTAMSDYTFYGNFHIYPSVENINSSLNNILDSNINTSNIKEYIKNKYTWRNTASIFSNLFSN